MASRQYQWQLKQRAKGLCGMCPEKNVDGYLCLTHLLKRRANTRKRGGYKAKVPGGKGRPYKYIPEIILDDSKQLATLSA